MADINENKPRYKKTKVGWIPEEWKAVLLGKNTKVFSGGTPKSTEKTFYGGDIPWIRSTEVNQGEIHSTEKTLTTLGLENSSAKLVKPGTLLMALYGATAGVIGVSKLQAAINQAVLAVLPKNNLHSDFLKFYLKWYSPKMVHRFTQGGQPNLSATIFKRQRIPLPPLPEQQKIARILSTWDAAIRKLDQLIERKQSLKKGLMQQLLTGRRRFPEFVPAGGTRYRDTKLGKVPEDWEVVKLKEIAKSLSRKNVDDNSDVVLTASAQYGLVDQITFFNKSVAGRDLTKYYLLKKGEFAYNRSYSAGYDYGAIKRLTDYENGALSTLYICFSVNEEQTAQYLVYYFETQLIQRELFSVVQEGARNHGLLNVSKADFYNINLVIPSKKEMRKLTQVMKAIDDELAALQKQHRQLEQQKKGLMQQLLTGAVRVKA